MNAKALVFKRLNLTASGMITGGYLQYNADDSSGIVEYNGEVGVHFLFVSKTFPAQGTTVIDPSLLLSANVVPGKKLNFPGVEIEVVSVADKKASCKVAINNGNAIGNGLAVLDLSQKDISVDSVVVDGTVMGMSVHIELA